MLDHIADDVVDLVGLFYFQLCVLFFVNNLHRSKFQIIEILSLSKANCRELPSLKQTPGIPTVDMRKARVLFGRYPPTRLIRLFQGMARPQRLSLIIGFHF